MFEKNQNLKNILIYGSLTILLEIMVLSGNNYYFPKQTNLKVAANQKYSELKIDNKSVIKLKSKNQNSLEKLSDISEQLKIINEQSISPEKIIPVAINQHYEIKAGDISIMKIDKKLATDKGTDMTSLAMKYTNRLRKAMGADEIDSPGQNHKLSAGMRKIGYASWYGPELQGNPTSSGELFDKGKLTAAHRRLPLGSIILVENIENGRKVIVKVNDRGPFAHTERRILDLSQQAFREIAPDGQGEVHIEISVLRRGNA